MNENGVFPRVRQIIFVIKITWVCKLAQKMKFAENVENNFIWIHIKNWTGDKLRSTKSIYQSVGHKL